MAGLSPAMGGLRVTHPAEGSSSELICPLRGHMKLEEEGPWGSSSELMCLRAHEARGRGLGGGKGKGRARKGMGGKR